MSSRDLPTSRPNLQPARDPQATSASKPAAGGTALVSSSQGAPAPVDGTAPTGVGALAPVATGEGDDPLIGSVVAERFRLVERLGAGGMGAVYRGEHVTLRNRVAIKFLHREFSRNKELVARFEREAKVAANLDHPNVVTARDFGSLPDGTFFLVMEYVDGRTLRKVLQQEGQLSPERSFRFLKQIGAALASAHAKGVVHRDLKPENVVVVEREDEGEIVKVIDFGIARVSGSAFDQGGVPLTQMGTVFGTPEYMAPEQAMGQAVDARADQYALGVIAFELFAGRRPFHAEDAVDLLRMQVGAEIPKLSAFTQAVPATLDEVIARMMAKRPADRYESVSAAIKAMEAALGVLDSRPQSTAQGPAPQDAIWRGARESVASSGPTPGPGLSGRTRLAVALSLVAMLGVSIALGIARPPSLPGTTMVSAGGTVDPRPFVARLNEYQQRPEVASALAESFHGRHDRAIRALAARAQANPQDPFAAYFLGTVNATAGRLGDALGPFETALRLEPALAADRTLVTAVVRALRDAETNARAEAMLAAAPLSNSPDAAELLAAEALAPAEGGRANARSRASAMLLVRRMTSLLSPLDAARIRLRNAADCEELFAVLRDLDALGPGIAADEADMVRRGDCSVAPMVPRGGSCCQPSGAARLGRAASGR